MIKEEIMSKIEDIKINKSLVSKIEKKYGTIPDIIMRIFSINESERFIGSCRVISNQEILNPEESIHVDFLGEKIVPVIDMMDNDYICYDLKKKTWTLYNIVDKVRFDSRKDIYEYIH